MPGWVKKWYIQKSRLVNPLCVGETPRLFWRNASFVFISFSLRHLFCWCSFCVALIWIITSVLIGPLSQVNRSGAADAEQNLKKAIALKDIHTLEVAPCRSRGWLNGYKASKQTVRVKFFFWGMIRVPQWVGIRPFIIAVELLPSVQKKHWRIRMIFLITFSRNWFRIDFEFIGNVCFGGVVLWIDAERERVHKVVWEPTFASRMVSFARCNLKYVLFHIFPFYESLFVWDDSALAELYSELELERRKMHRSNCL